MPVGTGVGAGAGGTIGGGVVTGSVAAPPALSDLSAQDEGTGSTDERVRQLEAKVTALNATIAQLQAALGSTQRRAQIERELQAQHAVDLETATLLTEAAVSGMSEPDIAATVRDLRKRKPFLFHGGAGSRGSAMSGAVSGGDNGLGRAADEARNSGDRAALLNYLRMRRGS